MKMTVDINLNKSKEGEKTALPEWQQKPNYK